MTFQIPRAFFTEKRLYILLGRFTVRRIPPFFKYRFTVRGCR